MTRSAETELQNTTELRATASEIVDCSGSKPGSRRQSEKKTILKHFLKGFLEGKSLVTLAPKWRKSADKSLRLGDRLCMEKHTVSCICYLSKPHFVRDFLQNSVGNSSTSTTCNPIYIAGTILQLQITMEFHWQLIHQHHLQSHLHCGNDPTVANHNGIPTISLTNSFPHFPSLSLTNSFPHFPSLTLSLTNSFLQSLTLSLTNSLPH